MSPEIRKNGVLIADVPDETGRYEDKYGKLIYVSVDLLDSSKKRQPLILHGETIGGTRIIGLTLQGEGSSDDPERGDKKSPRITVSLHEYIRNSITDVHRSSGVTKSESKQTYRNPRWNRSNVGR